MRGMTLDGLELLDAIERTGSFSGAAQALGKVTSTVSYAVGKLESDLGITLFRCNGPTIALTTAGRDLVVEGRLLLRAADDLECRVKHIANGWESELRINIDSLFPPLMFSGVLQSFCDHAKGTRIKLMSEALSGTWESLKEGRADLIIAAGSGPSGGGFQSKKLADLEFVFCVASNHPLAQAKEPLANSEIKKHRAIVVSDTARGMPTRTVGLLWGQEMLAVPDMRTKHAFQVAGLGVGGLPVVFAKSAIDRGLLIEKAVEETHPPDQIYMAWRNGDTGKALKWWREALGKPGVVKTYLERASFAWGADF